MTHLPDGGDELYPTRTRDRDAGAHLLETARCRIAVVST
jgi:hypothetical protein